MTGYLYREWLGDLVVDKSLSRCLLVLVAVIMLTRGCSSSKTESDDHFLNCETTKNTQLLHDHRHNNTRCLNSTHCKLTDTVNRENNVTYEYSMTLNKSLESDDSCLLLACSVDYDTTINNSRCVLYRHNCRENICDDITTGDSEKTILIVFLVIFILAFVIAAFVLLTLILMIRDMQNERIQNKLPNPYSCIFSGVRTLCACIFSRKSSETEASSGKKPSKEEKSSSAPKHYRRKETEPQQTDESPDHDPDDYEEMEHQPKKRDSFVEGTDDDVYQNY